MKVASRAISCHHRYIHIRVGGIVRRGVQQQEGGLGSFIQDVIETRLLKIDNEIRAGQGLILTIWKGCGNLIIILKSGGLVVKFLFCIGLIKLR